MNDDIMRDGWFKFPRALMDEEFAKNPGYLAVWLFLMSRATHKEIGKDFNGEWITLRPGQLITGLDKIAEGAGVTNGIARGALKFLEKSGEINKRSTSKGTLITVLSWDVTQETNKPLTNDLQTINKPLTTNKKIRNKELENRESHTGAREENQIPTLEAIRAYCVRRKNGIDAASFYDYYAARGWRLNGDEIRDWKALIRRWEKRESQPPKKQNQFHNFEQRNYDYDFLEQKLLKS